MHNPIQIPPTPARPTAPESTPRANSGGEGGGWWDHDGFSFGDILDMVNPLQHIPVISNIYRQITGDDIGHIPRVVGGTLLGGLLGGFLGGFASSAINAVVKGSSGKDVGEHVMAALSPEADAPAPGESLPSGGVVTAQREENTLPQLDETALPNYARTPAGATIAAREGSRGLAPNADPLALALRQAARPGGPPGFQVYAGAGAQPHGGSVEQLPMELWESERIQAALDRYETLSLRPPLPRSGRIDIRR